MKAVGKVSGLEQAKKTSPAVRVEHLVVSHLELQVGNLRKYMIGGFGGSSTVADAVASLQQPAVDVRACSMTIPIKDMHAHPRVYP